MYEPYPSGTPAQQARPAPPSTVTTAVRLMYAGAVVSAISLIVSLVRAGAVRDTIHNAQPSLTSAQLHGAVVVYVASSVILGLLGIGLWIWMAIANRGGRSWARIVASVFFGIDTLLLLISFVRVAPALGRLLSILVWLIGLAAVVMLWRRDSSEYFRQA